jgi:hypothetical protein
MIGLDTSHTVAFARLLNHPAAPGHIPGAAITAAFRSGSADMPERSLARIPGFAAELAQEHGVALCDSIEEVLARCDAVMIENVDGRKHLEVARAVFPAGKPVFIDKPFAGSLATGREIARLARQCGVPLFSASALRYARAVTDAAGGPPGTIRGAVAYSPCDIEPHHPDLFWLGIHGVEMLYALLGTGCLQVTRAYSPEADIVIGHWPQGRTGVFYGYRGIHAEFGFTAFRSQSAVSQTIVADYAPMLRQIVGFFQTRRAPVSPEEIVEVLAFMEAADESRRRGGAPVALAGLLRPA